MTNPQRPDPSDKPLPTAIELSELSLESLEVLDHFGVEAPHLLNQFAISLEDALLEQVKRRQEDGIEIKRLQALLTKHNIPYETNVEPNSPA